MTRKDYILIARSLLASWNDTDDFNYSEEQETVIAEVYRHIIMNLASALTETNPQFDFNKFVAACGIQD